MGTFFKKSLTKIFKIDSLLKKTLLGLIIIFVLTSVIAQIYLIINTKKDLTKDLMNKGNSLNKLAAFSMDDSLWNYNLDSIKNNVEALMNDEDVLYVEVTDTNAKVLYSKGKSNPNYLKFKQNVIKDSNKIGYVTIELTTKNIQSNIKTFIINQIIMLIAQIIIITVLVYFFIKVITKPIKLLQKTAASLTIGDVNINIEKIPNDEIGQLTLAFKEMVKSIKEKAEIAEKLAKGDMNIEINPKSEQDILGVSMKSVAETLKLLVNETTYLTNAGVDGYWDKRGDADKFTGGYKDIISGINNTMDSIIEPIKEALEVLGEFSNGNLEVYVKGNYKGDHNKLKDTLNTAIKSIRIYTDEIEYILNQISKGNLNVSITNNYYGNYTKIKDSLNLIIDSLNYAFKNIYDSTNYVAQGSKEVANGSQLLSQNSMTQFDVAREISNVINNIQKQAVENTEIAKDLKSLAMKAMGSVDTVNEQMKILLNAINDIGIASRGISKIIKVIDDIAFQTNILAINAAIEAARAGVYGKGFVVVADEVRALSIKSSSAAKETNELIKESMNKINIGNELSLKTANSLSEILEIVVKTSDFATDISSSSENQTAQITNVNKNISEFKLSIQSNSATSEESAASSQELSSQAETLKNILLQFEFKNKDNDESIRDLKQVYQY